jgi:hypothetical protein
MDISKIHFQNARIIRVIENTDQRRLTFEVSYPLDEHDSDFRRAKLIFECYSRYLVSERDLNGEPTISQAEIIEENPRGVTIRIKTDYGLREVGCLEVGEERAERKDLT